MMRNRVSLPSLLFVVWAGGCVGAVSEGGQDDGVPPGPGTGPGARPQGSGGSGAPPGPTVPVDTGPSPAPGAPARPAYAPLSPAPATMVRLTQQQFGNSIADVFGVEARPTSPLEADETTATFRSIGAARVGTSERGVEQYRDAALEIAAKVMARRAQIPGLAGCAATKSSEPCVAAALKAVGLRLFRRPLAADELQRWVAVVGADGEGADKVTRGLEMALAGMIMAPSTLHLVQVGEKDPGTGALRFTSWEMASRLSYFIWDSTPDQELLDAAAANQLTTRDGVAAQVKRMLGKPRARGLVSRYLGESWKVIRLDDGSKSTKAFPLWSGALLKAYREEFGRVLEDMVARGADLRDALDTRETFANRDLAKVYGMTVTSADFVRTALDDRRSGLLTAGAVLAANSPADRSSPTHRGVFVRERLLCQEVPAPPANVDSQLIKPDDKTAAMRTIRDVLEQHRKDPACAPCHGFFDPIGLTFENFDGIAAYRTKEANGLPIDATGEMDGRSFRSVRELAAALKGDERVGRCIAHQLYDFATGHEATPGEKGVVQALGDAFAAARYDFSQLVAEVATSSGFRYLAPTE